MFVFDFCDFGDFQYIGRHIIELMKAGKLDLAPNRAVPLRPGLKKIYEARCL